MTSRMRNAINLFAAVAACALLFACQAGGGTSEQGITAKLYARLAPVTDGTGAEQPQPAGTKNFTNSEGTAIRIRTGYLVLWSVALESGCDEPDFVDAAPWWSGFIRSAHAHAESTPLKLGVPHVIDLAAAESQPVELGSLTPPPGDYCGIKAELLRADDDAVGLPEEVDMIGRVLYVEGEYLDTGGTTWVPFVIETGMNLREAKRMFSIPLTLSDQQRTASVTVSIPYHRWFDGAQMGALDDPVQLDRLLGNIGAGIQVTTQTP